jgi:hypothetical protein
MDKFLVFCQKYECRKEEKATGSEAETRGQTEG